MGAVAVVTESPLGDSCVVAVHLRVSERAFDVKGLDEKFVRNPILILRPQNTLNLELRVCW